MTDVALRTAYIKALSDYKPWHQHTAWNSSGHDAFWQVIDGGMKIGLFDVTAASKMFNESSKTIMSWVAGEVPPRKTRIKVWKTIRKLLN